MEPWEISFRDRITSIGELSKRLTLRKEEEDFFRDRTDQAFPFSVTGYYLSLIDKSDPADPVRRQCIPTAGEFRIKPCEIADPLFEERHSPLDGVVRRYADRALVLSTGVCAVYCRHCFRRYNAGGGSVWTRPGAIKELERYLGKNRDMDEVIVSGGDPLTLHDGALASLLEAIRRTDRGRIIRVSTRMPVVLPSRVTDGLVTLLKRLAPLYLVTQFNHPNEITGESTEAMAKLAGAGIVLLNQTVLLRGVNDDPAVLSALFRQLARIRVRPYYLFQGDLASGTSHFRVNLERGLGLYQSLCRELSGLARPAYALDLTEGGGKVLVQHHIFREKRDGFYLLEGADGNVVKYPVE